MGTVLNACKSSISNKVKSTPQTINESHLTEDDGAYRHQRKFENEFLKNTEDLIQEISTNSQWQHHETRYLLSQFRKLAQHKEATQISTSQFQELVPALLRSLLHGPHAATWTAFQSHKLHSKWLRHFIALFSTPGGVITFQSFANSLSTACRGDKYEKAQCTYFYPLFSVRFRFYNSALIMFDSVSPTSVRCENARIH